jgi:hypothetical protein
VHALETLPIALRSSSIFALLLVGVGRLRAATSAAADDVAAVAAAAVWPPRSRFRYALNDLVCKRFISAIVWID